MSWRNKKGTIPGCCNPSHQMDIGPVLSIKHLSVYCREKPILKDVSFDISPKSVLSVLGPSGVGKSTLLKSINRLIEEEPGYQVSGEILLRGINILDPRYEKNYIRHCIGLIFQKPTIFPISIFKNVIFGVHHLKLAPKKEYPRIVESLLRKVSLWNEVQDRLNEPATQLSVGQQQRLAIARTLAVNPEVLLMDEPTSALDPQATEKIEKLITKLKEERGIVLVTHQPKQAERLSDHIIHLELNQGAGSLQTRLHG